MKSLNVMCACAAALVMGVGFVAPAFAYKPQDGRLGFVVKDWFTAIYQTKFMDECPEGLSIANDEIWWRNQSKADRTRITDNGMIQALDRYFTTTSLRGPNRTNVCLDPWSVNDPPQRLVEGKISYGVNLDGRTDGQPTAKTCAHEDFVGPDGTPGVDNQLYRLLGCTYGWRSGAGTVDNNANDMRGTSGLAMILIEITGVDDARNDDDVTVTFYRSIDQWVTDSEGVPLPFTTYAIDMADGKPRYGDSLKGSIKDGVLQTVSGDVRLPYYGNYNFMHPVIRDMSLRLVMDQNRETAAGMIAGYYSVEEFTNYIGGMAGVVPVNGINCPSLTKAAYEIADGYPDPETGKCTMLSSAFDITAYAAFVNHRDDQKKVAQGARR